MWGSPYDDPHMRIFIWGSPYEDLHMRILIWGSSYEDPHMRISIWRSPYEDRHMRIFIWESSYEDLHMSISIWGSPYEDLHMKILIWGSLYEDLHMKILIWGSSYGDPHMRISIWGSPYISDTSVQAHIKAQIKGLGSYIIFLSSFQLGWSVANWQDEGGGQRQEQGEWRMPGIMVFAGRVCWERGMRDVDGDTEKVRERKIEKMRNSWFGFLAGRAGWQTGKQAGSQTL